MPPCKRIEEKQHLLAQVSGWTLDAACVCQCVVDDGVAGVDLVAVAEEAQSRLEDELGPRGVFSGGAVEDEVSAAAKSERQGELEKDEEATAEHRLWDQNERRSRSNSR